MSSPSFHPRTVLKSIQHTRITAKSGVISSPSIGKVNPYFDPFAIFDRFIIPPSSTPDSSPKIGFHPHPHRGVSLLTYVLPDEGNGSLLHKSHNGTESVIGLGDFQYISTGKGIVHSEMPHDEKGVSGVHIIVNLKQSDKMTDPICRDYSSHDLPCCSQDGGFIARVIIGQAENLTSPVQTLNQLRFVHYFLPPLFLFNHALPSNWNAFIYSLKGTATVGELNINPEHTILFNKGELDFVLDSQSNEPKQAVDSGITLTSGPEGFDFLLLAGEPLPQDECVVSYGPVIMNHRSEIGDFYHDLTNNINGFEGYTQFAEEWRP